MYASYHWARTSKKSYILRVSAFVVLASLLSVILPFGMITDFFFFPFLCWSFPFYAYIESAFSWEHLRWVDFYRIRFLTVDLTSAFPLGGRAAIPRFPLMDAFSLFLFVNVVGVMLGYGLGKIGRIREWGNRGMWQLMSLTLGIILLLVGFSILYSNLPVFGDGRIVRPAGQYLVDGKAIFYFGIVTLLIELDKTLWGYKDKLLRKISENIKIEVS